METTRTEQELRREARGELLSAIEATRTSDHYPVSVLGNRGKRAPKLLAVCTERLRQFEELAQAALPYLREDGPYCTSAGRPERMRLLRRLSTLCALAPATLREERGRLGEYVPLLWSVRVYVIDQIVSEAAARARAFAS